MAELFVIWMGVMNTSYALVDAPAPVGIEVLIPFLIEAGIDCIWPLEGAANMDPVKIRKLYGKDLALLGGIDKRELSKDKKAIEEELKKKILPMLETGGYIPTIELYIA